MIYLSLSIHINDVMITIVFHNYITLDVFVIKALDFIVFRKLQSFCHFLKPKLLDFLK